MLVLASIAKPVSPATLMNPGKSECFPSPSRAPWPSALRSMISCRVWLKSGVCKSGPHKRLNLHKVLRASNKRCVTATISQSSALTGTRSHSRGLDRPRFALRFSSSRETEQGMPWCALHPRSRRVQGCTKESAHEHTGSAEAVRHSLRNGFTAYAVISPATNSSCHRRCRLDG